MIQITPVRIRGIRTTYAKQTRDECRSIRYVLLTFKVLNVLTVDDYGLEVDIDWKLLVVDCFG